MLLEGKVAVAAGPKGEVMLERQPSKQFLTVKQVTGTVAFLCSEDAGSHRDHDLGRRGLDRPLSVAGVDIVGRAPYVSRMVTLDIISDPICPWCYIGKARLDAAIAETGTNPFQVNWRIFELNPDMPPEGMDRKQYLEAKFGGPEGAAQVYDRINREAERSGLNLRFDQIPRTPNTFDAHRLLRWAQAAGAQERIADELFRRYFEQGQDISDHAVLAEVAESAGMERPVVERLLASDADREALREEEESIRGMGVQGVPCFVIAGKYVLQGAQETETWKQVIAELDAAIRKQAEEQEAPPAAE